MNWKPLTSLGVRGSGLALFLEVADFDVPQSTLVRRLGVSPSSVSVSVAKLSNLGLVEQVNSSNRRSKVVAVTSAGRKLFSDMSSGADTGWMSASYSLGYEAGRKSNERKNK